MTMGQTTSKASKVLEIIAGAADKKGYASKDLTSVNLAAQLGWTVHDTNKLLFDLQHRGLLSFTKIPKQGRDGTVLIYGFRLTKQALSKLKKENEVPHRVPTELSIADRIRHYLKNAPQDQFGWVEVTVPELENIVHSERVSATVAEMTKRGELQKRKEDPLAERGPKSRAIAFRLTAPETVSSTEAAATMEVHEESEVSAAEAEIPIDVAEEVDVPGWPMTEEQVKAKSGSDPQGGWCNWCLARHDELSQEQIDLRHRSAPQEVVPSRILETEEATTPPPPPPVIPQYQYPKLVALLDRKRLAEDAAEILEALGADSMAVQALELVDTPLTPLQKEVAEFFANHPSFIKFVLDQKK